MLFAEDLTPGLTFTLDRRQLSADEIVDFARQWDPMPFHVDAAYAGRTAFGGLIASGVHTIAVAQRLLFDAFIIDTAVIAGLGVDEVRLRRPVRPETVITGVAEIVEQRLREDGRGVVAFTTTLTDGDGGETLLTQRTTMLVQRRPVEG